jgi:hypothetical protein
MGKKKTKLITCKQQNNTKIERTTNEAQWLLQRFMMLIRPLLWHFLQHFMMTITYPFPPVQIIAALHPLGYFFIQTFIYALFTPKKNRHIFKSSNTQNCLHLSQTHLYSLAPMVVQ